MLTESPPPVETLAKVVRADQRKVLIYPGSGIRNELLSPDLQRAIQLMWIVMAIPMFLHHFFRVMLPGMKTMAPYNLHVI